ncbi:hypothetical protein DL98DRAFT_595179 [Cadophora sp. DSE1049]|nr:hypothetical protein DL98DRAFT_595179 [Cadophora sp. DSE1049]
MTWTSVNSIPTTLMTSLFSEGTSWNEKQLEQEGEPICFLVSRSDAHAPGAYTRGCSTMGSDIQHPLVKSQFFAIDKAGQLPKRSHTSDQYKRSSELFEQYEASLVDNKSLVEELAALELTPKVEGKEIADIESGVEDFKPAKPALSSVTHSSSKSDALLRLNLP